jgi:hypothetical protein
MALRPPASAHRPRGTGLSSLRASLALDAQWRWCGPGTAGCSGASACARGPGTARPTWRVRGATSRTGSPNSKTVRLNLLWIKVSPVFEIEVHQLLNTKVSHQLTPYQTYKSSRVVWSTDRAQFARKLDRKLGACEQWSSTLICIFHHLTLQTSNVTQQRSCVPWQTAHCSHWVILKCLVEFWRTCQKF